MKVVITGIGSVTSLGATVSSFWSSLLQGKSGISRVPIDLPSGPSFRLISEPKIGSSELFEHNDTPGLRYAYLAGTEAISNAKAQPSELNLLIDSCVSSPADFGFPKVLKDLLRIPNCEQKFSPLGNLDSACSAIARVQSGLYEKVLLIGVSHSVSSYFYEKILPMGILNTQDLGDPEGAIKCFDKNSRGTVLGEGATAILFESEESAIKRNCNVIARVENFCRNSDAGFLLRPSEQGKGLIKANQVALKDTKVDLVVADGAAISERDYSEAYAIESSANFAYVTSVKGYVGHLLGALGPTQLAAGALCIENVRSK